MKRDIAIEIAGQRIAIRSDDDEAYVRELAAYVEDKIRQLGRGQQQGVTTLTLAVTAALTIADELHKLRTAQERIDGVLDELSDRIEVGLARENA